MLYRKYTDIDLNFTKHPITKDIVKLEDEQAIIKSLENLVQFNFYELPFQPDVGGNVRSLLFENIDPLTSSILRKEIWDVITNFENRVTLDDINITPDFDEHGYNITITFYINNNPLPITIDFFLERLR